MPKKTRLEFFSPERIALNRETKNHPELAHLLASYPADDFEGRLGEIAAFCGVLVDGMYLPMELDNLCKILFFRLQQKRMTYIEDIRNEQAADTETYESAEGEGIRTEGEGRDQGEVSKGDEGVSSAGRENKEVSDKDRGRDKEGSEG